MMEFLFDTANHLPMQSTFKFHKLYVEGFSKNNCEVNAVSAIPVIEKSHNKILWCKSKEIEYSIHYYYPPFLNISLLKNLLIFINSFFVILYLLLRSKFNTYLVIDVLNASISTSAVCAAKLTGVKTIGIVTDLPQMLKQTLGISKLSFKEKMSYILVEKLLDKYNGYIFLTDYMNDFVNKKGKPYCIIEGLVDNKLKGIEKKYKKSNLRIILYSGGLYEKYGVITLIEAFMRLSQPDLQLSIYGDGNMVPEITNYCEKDKRIIFFGILPNERVVEAQANATLLVNPRPSNEEFTKYSFPSKNMEYMASGTPLVTTCLPGMPEEYYEYVFIFDKETVDGFCNTLNNLLSLPDTILISKGQICKNFVMEKKNNIVQVGKVLEMMEKI